MCLYTVRARKSHFISDNSVLRETLPPAEHSHWASLSGELLSFISHLCHSEGTPSPICDTSISVRNAVIRETSTIIVAISASQVPGKCSRRKEARSHESRLVANQRQRHTFAPATNSICRETILSVLFPTASAHDSDIVSGGSEWPIRPWLWIVRALWHIHMHIGNSRPSRGNVYPLQGHIDRAAERRTTAALKRGSGSLFFRVRPQGGESGVASRVRYRRRSLFVPIRKSVRPPPHSGGFECRWSCGAASGPITRVECGLSRPTLCSLSTDDFNSISGETKLARARPHHAPVTHRRFSLTERCRLWPYDAIAARWLVGVKLAYIRSVMICYR